MFLKNDHQNHWGFRMKMWSKIVFQQPANGAIFGRNHPTVDCACLTFGGYSQQSVGWTTSGTPGILYFHSSNGHNVVQSTNKIQAGVWQQVLVTFSTTGCSFYINGIPAGTVSGNNSIPSDASPATCCIGAFLSDAFNYPPQQWLNGAIGNVRFYNRALSTNEVAQLYALESAPIISIQKAVYLTSSNLWAGTNYQVQASTDLLNWTNQGSVFTATNSSWRSTNYWDVANWNQLFFRLQQQ
jgi:Concanavalin A-like lectin/glucanases superfamily